MLQRLNLVPPDPEPDPAPKDSAASGIPCASAHPPDPQAVQFVTEMSRVLAAGPKPEWLFFCRLQSGDLMFQPDAQNKVGLLFTSPFAATDYVAATKQVAQLRQVKFEDVATLSSNWLAAGASGLALNRCPRCPVILFAPLRRLADTQAFATFWAVRRATQLYFAQRLVNQFLADREIASKRIALQMIRDHVDCGIPYLYELLASFARMEGDEAGKNAAVQQLNQFGPPFLNWEARWDASSIDAWAPAMAEALFGLCQSVGIQFKTPE